MVMRAVYVGAACAALFAAACGGSSAPSACGDPLLIDDMEDGDRFICASGGRQGEWYVIDDGTSSHISVQGEFTPEQIPGGQGASRRAAHFTGFDFTDWGAAMGFSLDDGAATQPYDASTAGGIRFWMKSNVPVAVMFPIPATVPQARAAGACADDAADVWNCDNHFQFYVQPPPSSEWIQYDVPYAALAQQFIISAEGARMGSATWDPSQLMNIQFGVGPYLTFDVWIDDVRFYSCSANACVPTCTDPARPLACPATGASPASCQPAGTICAQALSSNITGVWGFAADDVWASGFGTFLHWNGTTWSVVPSATTDHLSVRWGSAPGDIWAVGFGGGLAHWDGSTWSRVASGTDRDIFGAWGSERDDVWATGAAGTILHWDGTAWSPVPSGTSLRLWRVWGSGRDDVWAVGISDTTASVGVIVHWNGSTWSPSSSDTPGLMGVWGSGRDDVWAVGPEGNIRHFDGAAWTAVPSGTTTQLLTVGGSGPDDVWAVGLAGTILHWNGVAWSPVPNGKSTSLMGVWARTPSDAWIVGEAGTILHWDGSAWTAVPVEVQ
jgi:hypothetical protein